MSTTVKEGTIHIDYQINEIGNGSFDWTLDNRDESDEWFESLAEAEADLLRRFS